MSIYKIPGTVLAAAIDGKFHQIHTSNKLSFLWAEIHKQITEQNVVHAMRGYI